MANSEKEFSSKFQFNQDIKPDIQTLTEGPIPHSTNTDLNGDDCEMLSDNARARIHRPNSTTPFSTTSHHSSPPLVVGEEFTPDVQKAAREVFLTASQSFRRMGDLLLSTKKSKYNRTDEEIMADIKESLSVFASELENISDSQFVRTGKGSSIYDSNRKTIIVSNRNGNTNFGPVPNQAVNPPVMRFNRPRMNNPASSASNLSGNADNHLVINYNRMNRQISGQSSYAVNNNDRWQAVPRSSVGQPTRIIRRATPFSSGQIPQQRFVPYSANTQMMLGRRVLHPEGGTLIPRTTFARADSGRPIQVFRNVKRESEIIYSNEESWHSQEASRYAN